MREGWEVGEAGVGGGVARCNGAVVSVWVCVCLFTWLVVYI
jgi:hypothetical protein